MLGPGPGPGKGRDRQVAGGGLCGQTEATGTLSEGGRNCLPCSGQGQGLGQAHRGAHRWREARGGRRKQQATHQVQARSLGRPSGLFAPGGLQPLPSPQLLSPSPPAPERRIAY